MFHGALASGPDCIQLEFRKLKTIAPRESGWPSGRNARHRPAEPRTNRDQGIDQPPHMGFGVIGRRRDPKPLLPARDGRIVDRLNADVVIREQEFTGSPAQMSVTDHQRQDMTRRIGHRHVRDPKHRLQPSDILPLASALRRMGLEMPHGGQCAGGEMRAKRSKLSAKLRITSISNAGPAT